MVTVLEITGKLFSLSDREERIKNYAYIVKEAVDKGGKVAIVVGGGKLAKESIETSRKLGADNLLLDEIGIMATKLNALIFLSSLTENAYPKIAENIYEAVLALKNFKIVVSGGLTPGHSTDAVAALIAEKTGAHTVIKCSNVNGIYDKDPKMFRDAKKIGRMTYRELGKLISKLSAEPGLYEVMDPVSVKILERSKIKLHFIDGLNPENLLRVLNGEEVGTVVYGGP